MIRHLPVDTHSTVAGEPPTLRAAVNPGVSMHGEATYICEACGEEIVIPVDPSAGEEQEYVEDCPVCCRPNVIHVTFDPDGDVRVWAESE